MVGLKGDSGGGTAQSPIGRVDLAPTDGYPERTSLACRTNIPGPMTRSASADQKYQDAINRFDDLGLVSNDLTGADGLTLIAVVRNELFYLPSLLAHYRSLGVSRFIFLDDHSTDGSRSYLACQADCMVVESQRRFNDRERIDHPIAADDGTARVRDIWMTLLAQKYTQGRWSVQVDADEFMRLPEGLGLPELARMLDRRGDKALSCVMIDLYPAHISDLAAMKEDSSLDTGRAWYYDARQHFTLPGAFRGPRWSQPNVTYPGSRARLMHQWNIRPKSLTRRLEALYRIPRYNLIRKVPLVKFETGTYYLNPHRINKPVSTRYVLPLEHFKFSGQLYARTEAAIRRKSHFDGSAEYQDIELLLRRMTRAEASFLCKCSSSDRSFSHYARSKVALGFG
ncbi:glycosyltransferase family 2 protein [Pseudooceanicola antarcticus]|uniref:Glycosyltransferase family 2 protein n=2 Tax=Pseudooceanicola antarcticus TaxID=1247613 RepID=A0ABX4MQX2_9RHOB|nr:glycosyltransferase family 2 protein [Pseudooceanicola antarcticus]